MPLGFLLFRARRTRTGRRRRWRPHTISYLIESYLISSCRTHVGISLIRTWPQVAPASGCRVARTAADIPDDVVPEPRDKRPNPKARHGPGIFKPFAVQSVLVLPGALRAAAGFLEQ